MPRDIATAVQMGDAVIIWMKRNGLQLGGLLDVQL
jgi:hypothetical protein